MYLKFADVLTIIDFFYGNFHLYGYPDRYCRKVSPRRSILGFDRAGVIPWLLSILWTSKDQNLEQLSLGTYFNTVFPTLERTERVGAILLIQVADDARC